MKRYKTKVRLYDDKEVTGELVLKYHHPTTFPQIDDVMDVLKIPLEDREIVTMNEIIQ